MFTRASFSLWLVLGCAMAVPYAALAERPVITSVNVETHDNNVEYISFSESEYTKPFKTIMLQHPDRIAIDIPKTNGAAVRLPSGYNGRLVKAIRFGQFDTATSRIVLDLNVPVTVKTTNAGNAFGIEIAPVTPLPALAAATPTPTKVFNAKEMLRPPVQSIEKKTEAKTLVKPVAEPAKDVAKQEKPLIAIDAGHGGQDPGAIGLHETHERDVTLNFARHLAEALNKTGRYRTKLIREDDHFVMLNDRVAIARRAKADLFISFHADSNPNPEARGLSIYTLSSTASDDEAGALAERENKSDIITGLDLNTTDQDVANILIDLTQRETMNKSLTLADTIVSSMSPKINRLAKTHRFAGFRVLKAPDVPSVLIELGFLTNPTDERLLLSPDYRDLVIGSVTKGIDRYYAAQ